MQQTFDDHWAYAQFATGWTNAMLQPPPPHVINILVAAQSKPKVEKAFVNGFDDPRTLFPLACRSGRSGEVHRRGVVLSLRDSPRWSMNPKAAAQRSGAGKLGRRSGRRRVADSAADLERNASTCTPRPSGARRKHLGTHQAGG